MNTFWTTHPEKLPQLLALREQALSTRQMGMKLGCSRNSVIGKLARMNLHSLYEGAHTRIPGVFYTPRVKALHKPTMPTVKRNSRVDGNSNLSAARLARNDERLARPAYGAGKQIVGLGTNQCRYSTGFDKKGNYLFCAAETDGGSWCSHHAARVFKIRGAG